MSSSQLEHVFYNAHSKVSHYVLRHTSHRLRSVIEHAVLGLAVCGFCVVILSHRTFVHREDIESITRRDDADGSMMDASSCNANNSGGDYGGYGLLGLGFIGEGRGVSVYSIVVQLIRSGYAWMVSSSKLQQLYDGSKNGTSTSSSTTWPMGKTIPGSCLKSIPGFRGDADVNHILLQYDDGDVPFNRDGGLNDHIQQRSFLVGSRAFTIHRGNNENEQIVSGIPTSSTQQYQQQQLHSCVIRADSRSTMRQRSMFGFAARDESHLLDDCSHETIAFIGHHGYISSKKFNEMTWESSLQNKGPATSTQQQQQQHQRYSPIVYSYSHSQGLLRLQPSLLHTHNITTQFIIASTTDPNCFGEPFAQSIIFRLVGPDTVILNWILGVQHATARPRFVYHWKTRKELDLDVFDMDHYAFSGKKPSRPGSSAHESIVQTATTTSSTTASSIFEPMLLANMQKYPLYRFLRFLTFKLMVLLSTLLIFFLTTSLVSFTFQETQDRMLDFTLQLQTRVRNRMPLGGLVLGHVLENLVFVPIMVGMIFFLIEFYGGDKFLAFSVLSMVWICEVFSAIR